MEWQHWAMVALFVVACVFPAVGLRRVYKKARAEWEAWDRSPKSDSPSPSVGTITQMTTYWHQTMSRGPVVALVDAALVGAGLLLGTAASIWAVVDSALG